MNSQPTLESERLLLRPVRFRDTSSIMRLAGEQEISDNTLSIPHPYGRRDAARWFREQRRLFRQGLRVDFVMELRTTSTIVGAIGLNLETEHSRGELGYWVGRPFWDNGYATEAARAVVRYAFDVLELNRLYAYHFERNTASGRVLENAGFAREGRLVQHVQKKDNFENLIIYGMLRSAFQRSK